MRYPRLFEEGSIGSLHLKNRIVMSPMNTHFTEDDKMTERYVEYYKERARGGAGLIITTHVKAEKKIDPYPLTYGYATLDSGREIKYFHEVTETAHRYGAKIAIELSPGTGRLAEVILPDKHPVGPSEIPLLGMPEVKTRALTREEIHQLVESYGEAARLAKQAGFDILYVHAAAYLADQFLTSVWNKRTDEYGGSLENRMRFLLECIASARKQIGDTFPLIVGLVLDHGFPGGRELNETIEICRKMKEIGIDALHLRRGSYDNMNLLVPTEYMGDAVSAEAAYEVKKAVSLPIIVDGNISDPDLAERLLAEGKLDFVGLGRALLSDPYWPHKVKAGKKEDITPCIRCMQCINRVILGYYAACSVNPRLGKEYLTPLLPADRPKRILVIGGGAAGMTFAMLAADKGHEVTLLEKKSSLGGHLLEAAVPAHKKEVDAYHEWLKRQVQNSDIDIRLQTEGTREYVLKFKPDALVVATGSVPSLPQVPGIDGPNTVLATEVLAENRKTGQKVVIVGAGLVGCETALYLSAQGKDITMIDMLPEIAADVIFMARLSLLQSLQEHGIRSLPGLKLKEVTKQGILVENENGEQQSLEADTVVLATGLSANNSLYDQLYGEVAEIYQIGDCLQPRKIIDATQEAFMIAKDI